MLVTPEKQSHWYAKDGQPCFQVPRKDGKGQRDPTVRDARELGLLPSVTSILRVIAKPGLEAWKQEQNILAALTLPRAKESIGKWISRGEPPGEPGEIANANQWLEWAYKNPPKFLEDDQVFAHRVVEDAEAQAGKAADFGRQIHKTLEQWFLAAPGSFSIEPELAPYLQSVTDWALAEIEDIYSAEKVVVNHHEGYAGTLDLHCRLKGIGDAVVDFKSQSIKNGKPVFYDAFGYQLAAYGAALSRMKDKETASTTQSPSALHAVPQFPALVSIVINNKEPGPIFCEQWKEPEKLWHLFRCAFELWKHQKGYEPQNSPRP